MRIEVRPNGTTVGKDLPSLLIVAETKEEYYFFKLYRELFSSGKVSIEFALENSEDQEDERDGS